MKIVTSTVKIPRISNEAIITRLALAAGIAGAALTSLVIGIPAVIISAGFITAIAAVIVLN